MSDMYSWRTLITLYNGMIGKAVVILSMATPLAYIDKFLDRPFTLFLISLAGSIAIFVGYILTQGLAPGLVKSHETADLYASYLMDYSDYLNLNFEFANQVQYELKNYQISLTTPDHFKGTNIAFLPDDKKGKVQEQNAISIISTLSDDFDKKSLVRILGINKYTSLNLSSKRIRVTLGIVFSIGTPIAFVNTFASIFQLFGIPS